jgi:hypothetical protein
VLRLPVPLVLFSCMVIIVDSLPSAKSVSFLVLELFSVLTVTVPLTISPGLYSAFSNLISKDKSVPFSNLLNIIDCHLFKGCRTDDLKFYAYSLRQLFSNRLVFTGQVLWWLDLLIRL